MTRRLGWRGLLAAAVFGPAGAVRAGDPPSGKAIATAPRRGYAAGDLRQFRAARPDASGRMKAVLECDPGGGDAQEAVEDDFRVEQSSTPHPAHEAAGHGAEAHADRPAHDRDQRNGDTEPQCHRQHGQESRVEQQRRPWAWHVSWAVCGPASSPAGPRGTMKIAAIATNWNPVQTGLEMR